MRIFATGRPWAPSWCVLTLAVGCGGLTSLNRAVEPDPTAPLDEESSSSSTLSTSTSTYPYGGTYDSVDTGTPIDTGLGTGGFGGSIEGTWITKDSAFAAVVLEFGPTSKDCYINFLGSGYYWAPCAYAIKGTDFFFADTICPGATGQYDFSAQTKVSLSLSLISDPKCKGRDAVLANDWDYLGPWGSFSY